MSKFICPNCNNPIYDDDALNCLYCGESLNRDTGFLSLMKNKSILFFVGIILLISFILLVVR